MAKFSNVDLLGNGSQASNGFMRLDSVSKDSAVEYRVQQNARLLREKYAHAKATGGGNSRLDALGDNVGLHLARQLEFVYAEVLKTKYAPTSALELFEVDRRVPAGARNHTVRRMNAQGQARFYEGNSSRRPTVAINQEEETFNVAAIETSIRLNFFDLLATDFSGIALRAELEDAARDVMDRFLNDKIWNGAPERKLPGVLTYPWVPKATSAITVEPGVTNPDALLASLHRRSNYAASKSKGLFTPNRMITSIAMRDYMASTKRSATTEDTILSAFLRDNQYIDEVIGVHDLRSAGPNGEDVALFDRRDRNAFVRVMPAEVTMLPMQSLGMDMEIPCYSIYGGMISREPLHNLITYYPTANLGS